MYDIKVKSQKEVEQIGKKLQIMEVMGMNRKSRREFMKTNNGLKVSGSNKPIHNTKKISG